MPLTSTERETIRRALAGDPEAFETVIRTYSRLVYAHAYSILRQPEEAEDVVQESFSRAYQSRRRVRDPEKFPQWLFSIARNRALDAVRRRRTVSLPDEAEDLPDPAAPKPDRVMEGCELRDTVHQALSRLPENHRLALTLRYLEGMDHHSIEQTLGLTNGALRGILGRALHSMRKSLQPVFSTEAP